MKKLLSIASSLIIGTAMLHAQGTVIFSAPTLGILTNTAPSHFAGGNETGGISGKTAGDSGSFTYALFIQTFTGTLSSTATNPLVNGWMLATSGGIPVMGTNRSTFSGSLLGPGGLSGVAIDGWALPTDGSYSSSGREYFLMAGWSSSLGSTWATFSPVLASGFASASGPGFFGVSTIGNAYAGGANSLSPQSLFSLSVVTPVPVTPFTLYAVVPEPTTMALAGLGGLAVLLFRRRK